MLFPMYTVAADVLLKMTKVEAHEDLKAGAELGIESLVRGRRVACRLDVGRSTQEPRDEQLEECCVRLLPQAPTPKPSDPGWNSPSECPSRTAVPGLFGASSILLRGSWQARGL